MKEIITYKKDLRKGLIQLRGKLILILTTIIIIASSLDLFEVKAKEYTLTRENWETMPEKWTFYEGREIKAKLVRVEGGGWATTEEKYVFDQPNKNYIDSEGFKGVLTQQGNKLP